MLLLGDMPRAHSVYTVYPFDFFLEIKMMGLIRALLSFLVFVHLTGPVVAATTVNTPQLDGLPASLNFLPVSLINSERSIY